MSDPSWRLQTVALRLGVCVIADASDRSVFARHPSDHHHEKAHG
jgi:hypothetical protein